ncbi:hypothetical protein [Lysobacter sp. HA18]
MGLAAALALLACYATAKAWMHTAPDRWKTTHFMLGALTVAAVAFVFWIWASRAAAQAENVERLEAASTSTLAVYEHYWGRAIFALIFTVLFGWGAYRDYVEHDPALGPVAVMFALPVLRLGWLGWRRATAPALIETTAFGLFIGDVGRIEWGDLVGVALREVRTRYATRMYLDLCIRRPDRYDLSTSVRAPGRDGFGIVAVPLRFASVSPVAIEAAILAARRRERSPFVESWGADMTGAEIHADLDEESLLVELEAIEPALNANGNIPPRAMDLLSRAPQVIRAAGAARVQRIERAGRRAKLTIIAMLLGLLVFGVVQFIR